MFDFLKRERPHEVPPEAATERKASATGRVIAWAGSGRVAWSPRDAVSLARAGFQGNPIGFRAVRLIAEAAAALPLICRDETRRFEVHPVISLLARPNPAQGRAELLEAIYGHLLLHGNAYVEAVAGPEPHPAELHALRPERMALVPGPDGWPVAYDYTVSGRTHRFAMEEGRGPICHIRSFHPQDDHYGLSPLQAAAVAIDVHNAASAWSKALLDNAARPSGAIVYRGTDGASALTSEQYERLVSEMETHHQGARNAGRPMLLEGGLDWKPMGFSPSDMEFHETKLAAAREIAVAFGVPPMLMGIPGDATYANYQEANRAFYRLTVLPLASRVLAALSHWLAGFTGEAVELRPDPDQIPALAIEARTGKALFSRAFLLQIARWRGGADHPLPVAPVSRIEKVVLIDRAGAEVEVPPARYWLAADLHRPRLVGRGAVLPMVPDDGRIVIELVAGFGSGWGDIPADLRQAVLLLAAEYYEHRHDGGVVRHGLPLLVSGLIEGWRQVRVLGGAGA